jgi:hypothetical protein
LSFLFLFGFQFAFVLTGLNLSSSRFERFWARSAELRADERRVLMELLSVVA